jgi:dCTP deaminase
MTNFTMLDTEDDAVAAPYEEIAQFISQRGMTQEQFAHAIGTSRQSLNMILKGRKRITAEMSRRLSAMIGLKWDHFLQLQHEYEKKARPTNVVPMPNAKPAPVPIMAVGVLVDRDLHKFGSGMISPFNPANVQPASYDLSFGDQIAIGGAPPRDLEDTDEVEIDPGVTAFVCTLEKVMLPKSFCARLGPTSMLARNGIFVSAGLQVDPGYSGKLFVSLHNHGPETFVVCKSMPFLSLEIHRLGIEAAEPYGGPYNRKERMTPADPPQPRPNHSVPLPQLQRGLAYVDPAQKIPVADVGDGFAASLCGFTYNGETPTAAMTILVDNLCKRFVFTRKSRAENSAWADQYAKISQHICYKKSVAQQELQELASRLGAQIIEADGADYAIVLNDGAEIVDFTIPRKETVLVANVAAELRIDVGQCEDLLFGNATRDHYLSWIGRKP